MYRKKVKKNITPIKKIVIFAVSTSEIHGILQTIEK